MHPGISSPILWRLCFRGRSCFRLQLLLHRLLLLPRLPVFLQRISLHGPPTGLLLRVFPLPLLVLRPRTGIPRSRAGWIVLLLLRPLLMCRCLLHLLGLLFSLVQMVCCRMLAVHLFYSRGKRLTRVMRLCVFSAQPFRHFLPVLLR